MLGGSTPPTTGYNPATDMTSPSLPMSFAGMGQIPSLGHIPPMLNLPPMGMPGIGMPPIGMPGIGMPPIGMPSMGMTSNPPPIGSIPPPYMINHVLHNVFKDGCFYKPDGTRLGPQFVQASISFLSQVQLRNGLALIPQGQKCNYEFQSGFQYFHYLQSLNLKEWSDDDRQQCKLFVSSVFKQMIRYWFDQDNITYQKQQDNLKMEFTFQKVMKLNSLVWSKTLKVQKIDNPNDHLEFTFSTLDFSSPKQ